MSTHTTHHHGLYGFLLAIGLLFAVSTEAYAWHGGYYHGGRGYGYHGGWGHGYGYHGGWHRAGWGYGGWGNRGWGWGGTAVYIGGPGYYGASCAWVPARRNAYGHWIPAHRACW